MTPEQQLAHDLAKLRGDRLAQIRRLESEIRELRWIERHGS